MAKYLDLAAHIEQEIDQGTRVVGDKMPSLRSFARQMEISMTTAIATYDQLQDRGYLTAKPKSGFYVNKPMLAADHIEFMQFKSEVRMLAPVRGYRDRHLNNWLATAQVAPELMPLESIRRCIKLAFNRQSVEPFLYGPPQGNLALRENLSVHYSRKGLAVAAEQLLITCGCINAISLAVETVTKPGDNIAVSSPCYQGLLQVLALLGRKVVEIPSTRQGLDLQQLEALANEGLIKACLLTANFQNPTGHSLSVEQKQWLAAFAARMQIPLIEDDVFGELAYAGPMPLPIKAWDKQGFVIWCSSASKTVAPGLRIGWCAPGRYLAEISTRQQITTMGLNDSMAQGLARFIQTGNYARHIQQINGALARHLAQYHQYLTTKLPENAAISYPNGGMVLWLKLPDIDCLELAEKAANAGFELRVGNFFTSRALYQDHLRINIGYPFEQARPWLDRLIDLIKKVEIR